MMGLLSCYSIQLKPRLQVPSSLVGRGFFNLNTFMMEKEIWKDVKGYKGYQVSSFGGVRSWLKCGSTDCLAGTPKILKPATLNTGYLQVGLMNGGKSNTKTIHRLVAKAFLKNPKNKPQVNHKDGNKQNNFVSNLEWCTQSENEIHAYNTGLKKSTKYHKKRAHEANVGENNNRSILSEDDVKEIKKILKNGDMKHREIADIYGVTRSNISTINRNRSWIHID